MKDLIIGGMVGALVMFFLFAGILDGTATIQCKEPLVVSYKDHLYKLAEIHP